MPSTFNFSAPATGISFGASSGATTAQFPTSDTEQDPRADTTGEEAARRNRPFQVVHDPSITNPQPSTSTFQRTPLSPLHQPNGIVGPVSDLSKPNAFQTGRSLSPLPSGGFNFGATATQQQPATNPFAFTPSSTTATASTGFRFGTPPPVQDKQSSNIFSFGQSTTPAQPASTGFNFGSSQVPDKPTNNLFQFGQAPSQSQTSTSGTSFNSTPAFAQPSANLFGQSGASTSTSAPNLFGQINQPSAPSNNLFSNLNQSTTSGNQSQQSATTGTSLFGGQAQNPATANSLFGGANQQNAATPNLFPNLNQPSATLTSSLSQNQQSTQANSIFGAQGGQATPATNIFGPQNAQSTPTSSLFGNQKVESAPASTIFGIQKEQSTPSSNPFGGVKEQAAPSSSIFGNAQTSSNLFGQQPGSTTNIFGSKTPSTTTTSFGTQSQQSTEPGNLFAHLNQPTPQSEAPISTVGETGNGDLKTPAIISSAAAFSDSIPQAPASPKPAPAVLQASASTSAFKPNLFGNGFGTPKDKVSHLFIFSAAVFWSSRVRSMFIKRYILDKIKKIQGFESVALLWPVFLFASS